MTSVFYTPTAPECAVLPNLSFAIAQPLQPPKAKVVTIGEAIEELIIAKSEANRRKRYIKELRSALRLFARDRMNDPVDSFTPEDITRFFRSRNYCPSGIQAFTGRLGSLFGFCVRKGWIEQNPCMRLEKPTVERKPVNILTPAQCKTLLEYCHSKRKAALAYLVLCLVGCRPEEVCKLQWSDVSEDCKRITLDSHVTKTRKRRIVDVPPNLQLWLLRARGFKSTLPLSRTTKRRYLYAFCCALGFDTWPQDCLRHCAASYLLAKIGDIGKVATQLGNSPGIITKNYLSLVVKEQAEEFYRIRPPFEVVLENAA